MIVNSKALIEKCADVKGIRGMNEPHLDVENSKLIATDGHRMVVLPVELDADDTTGEITRDVLKSARKINRETAEVRANGGYTLSDGSTSPRSSITSYPNWERVVPPKGRLEIILNARYLHEISQALGVDKNQGIKLFIDPDDITRAMYVEPAMPNGDEFGVIMPIRPPKK